MSPLNGYNLSYPCEKQKFAGNTEGACKSSWSRHRSQKLLKRTIHWNLAKSREELSWNHRTSTPYRSETNGIAERAVRRVKEGTSAVLLQSGLNEKLWSDSMECCCYLRNVQDLLADGKTLCMIWGIIQRTNCSIRCTGRILPNSERKTKREFINLERKCYQF